MSETMACNDDSTSVEMVDGKVGTLIKKFDDTSESSESYVTGQNDSVTVVKDSTITVESTEIRAGTIRRVPTDRSWWDVAQNTNPHTVHITVNPTNSNNVCQGSLPDVGILRVNFPDSVAWCRHPLTGVTEEVHLAVLTAISEDDSYDNLMNGMQWTYTASLKPLPTSSSFPIPTPAAKFARLDNTTSPNTDESPKTTPQCYSMTLPPSISSNCDIAKKDDPMHHHVTTSRETVLVELWYTLRNIFDKSKHDEALLNIQKQVTTHVYKNLLNWPPDPPDPQEPAVDPIFRVFVVTSEMKSF